LLRRQLRRKNVLYDCRWGSLSLCLTRSGQGQSPCAQLFETQLVKTFNYFD